MDMWCFLVASPPPLIPGHPNELVALIDEIQPLLSWSLVNRDLPMGLHFKYIEKYNWVKPIKYCSVQTMPVYLISSVQTHFKLL